LTENARHEIDGREIGGQNIYRLKNRLHYNAACNSF